MKRLLTLVGESQRAIRSQPVASIAAVVMVIGMVVTVLFTTGRTVGAEERVIRSIDSAGTRSIVIKADKDSGLTSEVLSRIDHLQGIAWAGAFGFAEDYVNAAIPDGNRTPVRGLWSTDPAGLGIATAAIDKAAWASADALSQLGMRDPVGGIVNDKGGQFAIAGRLEVPDYLKFLEPMVVAPSPNPEASPELVAVLVVIAQRPDLVAPVAAAVQSVLALDDPTKVSITTSEDLATLRSLIQGQLGVSGRGLVLIVFAITAVLVATIMFGLVTLRRKDFGRRRALGASQRLIVALLLIQMVVLGVGAAVIGCVIAATALVLTGDPLPDLTFFAAVAVLAVTLSALAALAPALAAARRDPLTELRVP